MPVDAHTIPALLDAGAAAHPDRIAIIDPDSGSTLDYRTLRDRAARVARALDARGIARGDSVAFAMHNGIDAAVAVLGIQYGGFRAVAVNLVAGRDVIGHVLAHSESRLVLSHAPVDILVREALSGSAFADSGGTSAPPILDLDALLQSAGVAYVPAVTADDDALLMYTSGTTGRPKGVRLSHGNLLAGGANAASGHALGPDDRALCVLPLFHINGLCVTLYGPLISGGSVVMPTRFSASRFWRWIREQHCSWFSVVPTQIGYLLHATEPAAVPAHVRFGRSASAPLSPNVHEAFVTRFGVPLIETMGLTETAAQITCNPMPPDVGRIGSAGRAHGCRIRIVDGEIRVSGDNVMQGYLHDRSATSDAFDEEGWLRTGDLGRLDSDGFLFVTGRLKELIIKGGENIAPREIDEALHAHPDVLEAAAFGVPCNDYGERVEAVVVAVPGREIDIDELLALCEQRLGRFKRPDRLHVVLELPKGPSGKIQRRLCAALCASLPDVASA